MALTAMINDTARDSTRSTVREVFYHGSSLRFGSSPGGDYARELG
jgi:hypothetical protein